MCLLIHFLCVSVIYHNKHKCILVILDVEDNALKTRCVRCLGVSGNGNDNWNGKGGGNQWEISRMKSWWIITLYLHISAVNCTRREFSLWLALVGTSAVALACTLGVVSGVIWTINRRITTVGVHVVPWRCKFSLRALNIIAIYAGDGRRQPV